MAVDKCGGVVGKCGGPRADTMRTSGGGHTRPDLGALRTSRRRHWVPGLTPLQCECGHSMRVIAAITEPTVAKRILGCMGLPPRAPPLTKADAPGVASEPWPEETAAAGFDQSPPDDWDLGA